MNYIIHGRRLPTLDLFAKFYQRTEIWVFEKANRFMMLGRTIDL